MAAILTIPQILEVAKICEYLAANDTANQNFLKGESLDKRLPKMIYMERTGIQYLYNVDPTNSTLRSTANYLFAILGKYAIEGLNILNNLAASPPSITQPTNQSVEVGDNATFSTVATSTLPVTYQWYLNGSPIMGATSSSYIVTNAQLSQDGDEYTVTVTNAAGSVSSSPATLTVTETIEGEYFFGDVDYYAELAAGDDNITYNGSFSITDGDPLVVNFTSGAQNNKWNGIKYPISQGAKSAWENTPLNSGFVPDSVYRAVITIGSNLYIISRNAMSLDSTTQVVTFS